MKILVTGATGFIGSHVVGELLNNKHTVIASSRDVKKAKSYGWFKEVRFVPCDFNAKRNDFYSYFGKPELLIHLAWEGLPNYDEAFHMESNLFVNYTFLKNMVENGLNRMVVAGTCFEYGMQSGKLKENLNTRPNNYYGLAKDVLRKMLEQLQKRKNFKLNWVRLFYMYGRGQNPNSLLAQLDAAIENNDPVFNMSGGEQLRDYLPVQKIAKYIVKIALQSKVMGCINCCSGVPISVKELVEGYIEKRGGRIRLNFSHFPYSPYESMAFWGDNSKLKQILESDI